MADCNNCNCKATPPPVPYIAHEAELARAERINIRLCMVIAVQAAVLAVVCIVWLCGVP